MHFGYVKISSDKLTKHFLMWTTVGTRNKIKYNFMFMMVYVDCMYDR